MVMRMDLNDPDSRALHDALARVSGLDAPCGVLAEAFLAGVDYGRRISTAETMEQPAGGHARHAGAVASDHAEGSGL